MNILNSSSKYGLEIPELRGVSDPKEFMAVLQKNRDLIQRVADFLDHNGAQRIACGSASIIDNITSVDDLNPAVGVTFWGSRALAQKLANAFPEQRVISYKGDFITAELPSVRTAVSGPQNRPTPKI